MQNLNSGVMHTSRPGDGEHTACGWRIGGSAGKRGGLRYLQSCAAQPYHMMCEKCLLPERMAAQLASTNVQIHDNIESDDG